MMGPINATSIAMTLVDELVAQGVTDVVISPGSRSAPLSLAVAQRPELRMHVRVDERSAGFLALGLSRASGWPTVLICSSGTATANYHPAVLEADSAGVGLIVLTADRPLELRGIGANQTTDQNGLYGGATRWAAEVGDVDGLVAAMGDLGEAEPDDVMTMIGTALRSQIALAVAAAQPDEGNPGPVHLNVPLREPLLVAGTQALPGVASLPPKGLAAPPTRTVVGPGDVLKPRGLVIAGEGCADSEAVLDVALALGYPVLAEPTSNLRLRHPALRTGHFLAASAEFVAQHTPDVVVLLGRPVLSRAISALVGLAGTVVVCDPLERGWDPGRNATHVVADTLQGWASGAPTVTAPDWLRSWEHADESASAVLDAHLDGAPGMTELGTARDMARAMPDGSTLVCASSLAIRHLNETQPVRTGLRVVGNRGVSGIDGFISTAVGVALGSDRPTAALAGDLSIIHDLTGLVIGTEEPNPSLPIVVLNNDGGGIFDLLPYGTDVDPPTFRRLFATPHGVPLHGLAITVGCGYTEVDDPAELSQALSDAWASPGVTLIEVRTETPTETARHRAVQEAIATRLSGTARP